MRRLIMLFHFQGCLGLSFKNGQDCKITGLFSWALGSVWTGLHDSKIVFMCILEILYILSNFNKSSFSSCHFFVRNNLNQNYSGIF